MGHRHRPRPAATCRARPSSCSRSRSSFAGGTVLKFKLVQKPRRLEQRRQPEQQPRPLPLQRHDRRGRRRPIRCRLPSARFWRSPRERARPPKRPRSSATGARPCPSGRRPNEQIEALWQQHPAGTSQLAMQIARRRSPADVRPGARRLPEADASRSKPGVPSLLAPAERPRIPTRLDFARWLVDERSPTAARSIVNRVWQTYFGTGLVSTSEDFGLQGEAPSHPELLDWLAVEFMEHGWSLKWLHRLIVTLRHLSAIVARHAGAARPAIRTTACWPAGRGSAWKPKPSATSPWPPAAC